jgi:hypothetical protein
MGISGCLLGTPSKEYRRPHFRELELTSSIAANSGSAGTLALWEIAEPFSGANPGNWAVRAF